MTSLEMKSNLIYCIFFVFLTIFFSTNESFAMDNQKGESPYFLIKSVDPSEDKLPLLRTSADVTIAGVIADVTVTQVYKNSGKKPIEAIYVFPASSRAAVYGMTMRIGARTLIAKIQKKEEARQNYEAAKKEGKSASLLEQSRPNLFQMSVANIMPGDTIIVELKYTEMLIPTDGVYSFIYPTVAGPRYQGLDSKMEGISSNEIPYGKEGESPTYLFDIKLNINSGVPLAELNCISHKINSNKISDLSTSIALDESEKFGGNKDFVLNYRLKGGKIETGLILSQNGDEKFFLMMLQPPKRVTNDDLPKREYIFILDVSGSMHGFPLKIAKKNITTLLKSLNPSDKFNILFFSGGSEQLFPVSMNANEVNIQLAIQMIDGKRAGGGTELLPALTNALAIPKSNGFSRTYAIVTDGYVTVERQAFDLIRNNLDNSNFFTFGVGSAVNRYIIEGMARVGKGESFIALNESQADSLSAKFMQYISYPVMTDIQVVFDGFEAYDYEPAKIPDLMADRPIIIIGKWKGKAYGDIKVTGLSGEQNLSIKLPVSIFASFDTSQALKYLWAREKLMILSDYAALDYEKASEDDITSLGLKYNLLTKYTSFVAIDNQVRNTDSNITQIHQPLPLPSGVSESSLSSFGLAKSVHYLKTEDSYSGIIGNSKKRGRNIVESEPKPNEFSPVNMGASYNKEMLNKMLVYPDWAKNARLAGKVQVKVFVGKSGSASKFNIENSTEPILEELAIETVKKMSFRPEIVNGSPQDSWLSVPVAFDLLSNDGKRVKPNRSSKTNTGIYYVDIELGSGSLVKSNSKVRLHYKAFTASGVLIEDTKGVNNILEFTLGDANIMKGIEEGIIGMKAGGKRLLVIPPQRRFGGDPNIEGLKAGSSLILEIEILQS